MRAPLGWRGRRPVLPFETYSGRLGGRPAGRLTFLTYFRPAVDAVVDCANVSACVFRYRGAREVYAVLMLKSVFTGE